MGWTGPVTNRTKYQYQEAADYKRVEENAEYLLGIIKSVGYLTDVIQENKTDWSKADIDSLQQHLRIISNLQQIEFLALPGLKTLRTDLDSNPPTNQDYNDWETNLSIIYKYAMSSLNGIKRLSFRLGGGKLAT